MVYFKHLERNAGTNSSIGNDTTAGSTENLNENVTTTEVDQRKINEDKNGTGIKLNTSTDSSSETLRTSGNNSMTETVTTSERRLQEDDGSKEFAKDHSENKDNNEGVRMATVENFGGLEAEADSSFDLLCDNAELGDAYNFEYDDYVDEKVWGDEEWVEGQHENLEDYVNIDSHILCTLVIADIDKDGVEEMGVVVSYFFDPEYYDNPEHLKELGDLDIKNRFVIEIVLWRVFHDVMLWLVLN